MLTHTKANKAKLLTKTKDIQSNWFSNTDFQKPYLISKSHVIAVNPE